jgi:hypothetical protein
VTSAATLSVQSEVHTIVQRIIDRGIADGTVLGEFSAQDVIAFGAMLAQPTLARPQLGHDLNHTRAGRVRDRAVSFRR